MSTVTGKCLAYFFYNFSWVKRKFFDPVQYHQVNYLIQGPDEKIEEKICKTFAHDCNVHRIVLIFFLFSVHEPTMPFNTLEELAKSGEYIPIVEKGSSAHSLFKVSTEYIFI